MKKLTPTITLCVFLYCIITTFSVALAADTQPSNSPIEARIIELTDTINSHPNEAVPYYQRGRLYNIKNQYDLAISDFSQAIEINPKYSAAFFSRGISYEKKQEIDLAMNDYNKAINLDSSYALVYSYRGTIYYRNHKDNLALADSDKAIELEPTQRSGYLLKGLILERKLMYQEAIENYRKMIANIIPKDPETINAFKNKIRELGGTI